jgi:hypothetical protein
MLQIYAIKQMMPSTDAIKRRAMQETFLSYTLQSGGSEKLLSAHYVFAQCTQNTHSSSWKRKFNFCATPEQGQTREKRERVRRRDSKRERTLSYSLSRAAREQRLLHIFHLTCGVRKRQLARLRVDQNRSSLLHALKLALGEKI